MDAASARHSPAHPVRSTRRAARCVRGSSRPSSHGVRAPFAAAPRCRRGTSHDLSWLILQRETLRLIPPVYSIFRKCTRETIIPLSRPLALRNGSHTKVLHIPAGTTMTLSLTALNRSPELYGDDADQFRPGRWLEHPSAALETTRAYAAVPGLSTFIGGTRGCIGARAIALAALTRQAPASPCLRSKRCSLCSWMRSSLASATSAARRSPCSAALLPVRSSLLSPSAALSCLCASRSLLDGLSCCTSTDGRHRASGCVSSTRLAPKFRIGPAVLVNVTDSLSSRRRFTAMAAPTASPAKLNSVSHFVAPSHFGRSDATYVSQDGVRYHLHRAQLARMSDMFHDAHSFTGDDAATSWTPLAESAAVLDVILPFLYGTGVARKISRLKADHAIDVVQTALKYQVSTSVTSGMALALACVLVSLRR